MVYDLDKRSLISDSQTKKKIREYNIEPLLDIYILDRNYYCDADEATLEQSYNFDGVYGPIPNDDGTVDLSYWASNYYLKDGNPSELPAESKAYLDEVLTTGKYKVVNMSCMFYTNDLKTSTKLASLDVSNWDTSNVTDMFGMFFNCNELTTLDVSNWDTSNVTNMNNMFSNCNSLTTLDVSNWDTSNVTDMSYMFYQCNDLVTLDVSNWDTSNVKNMSNMFYQCNDLVTLDVSNWDTSNVTDMYGMFWYCDNLTSLDVSNWDTSNVTDMSYMFSNCNSLTTVTGTIDMSKVSSYGYMLQNTDKLQSINIKLPSSISQSDFLSNSKVTNTSAVHFVA